MSDTPLVVKWHQIGSQVEVKWLCIGRKVISVVFHCLSGITVEVKLHSIGNGLVELFSIGTKVVSVCGFPLVIK